jgi:hypothetical protein
MFGAKGPNSSQYDFKGTTVSLTLCSKNHLQALTSPPLQEQVALLAAKQVLEDHNLTKDGASQTSFKTRLMSSREPNTELPWLLKIPTILNKTSKKFKKKSTHSSRSVRI